jgi:hypothetical protein
MTMARIAVYTVVFAPMPIARQATAASVHVGFLNSVRRAYLNIELGIGDSELGTPMRRADAR